MSVQLRPINENDRDSVFSWRNTPVIVQGSTSERKVSIEEHDAWFNSLLVNKNSLAFIIETDGQPIGHIRFDKKTDECIITAYLLEKWTGKGYGVTAIKKACILAQEHWPIRSITAHVRKDNDVGRIGFLKAGFRLMDTTPSGEHFLLSLDCNLEERSTANRYRQLFAEHGHSHKTLNWGSQEGQYLRFRILAGIGQLQGKRILDVGCGLGDFAGWLKQNNIQLIYTGIDLSQELVLQARNAYPTLEFLHGSILDKELLKDRKFDYVFASGIFYTYYAGRENWMKLAIKRMWDYCEIGVAFNSLSTWSENHEPEEFHANPAETMNFCKTLTPWLALRHDYHPRDFTIFLLRSPST